MSGQKSWVYRRPWRQRKRGTYLVLVAEGQIAASTQIAFSESATLTGTGALAASASIDFSENAALTATGALQGSATLAFSETAVLTATGELQAQASVQFSESATLSATGALGAATSIDFSESATLSATGALEASASIAFSESATLSAIGELSASATIAFSEFADLRDAGGGQISASTSIAFSETAVLTGTGALSSDESIAFSESADLTAIASISASATIAFSESADLTDAGTGPAPQPEQPKGGRVRKTRTPKYLVEINGEFFDAESVRQVQILLEHTRKLAKVAAESEASAEAMQGEEQKPIRIKPPKIKITQDNNQPVESVTVRREVARTQAVIDRIYANSAARVQEIRDMAARREARFKRERDDEEAIISLLM